MRISLAWRAARASVLAVLVGGVLLPSAPAHSQPVAPRVVSGPTATTPPPGPSLVTDGARAQAAADRPDKPASGPQRAAPAIAASIPSGTWQPLGPAPIGPPFLQSGGFYGGVNAGRIDSVAVIPTGAHAGRTVVGTAGGGVWTSDDDGTTWTARTDQAPSLAIGAVADDPSNPDHLIAGTGEIFPCGDCYPGNGMLSSSDGGTTWTVQNPGGVFTGAKVGQVAIDQNNSLHMFAATNSGLFVTTNGGTTWAQPTDPSYGANVAGFVSAVVIDPTNPLIVYVGGTSKTVAKSTDGGLTWAAANTSITLPGGSFPLIALAISASSHLVLYASVGTTTGDKLNKTVDGGATWTLTNAPDFTGQLYSYGSGNGEQGWYDNTVAIDPINANHVVAGGIGVVETTDGGTTWTNVNGKTFFAGGPPNKVHPDFHAIAFRPDSKVWLGCDGGAFLYNPAGLSVANSNGNLNITQFYAGFNEVGGNVLAGAQDNGSARTSSPTVGPWTGIVVGDGGPSAITPNSSPTQFSIGNMALRVTTDGFASTLTNITPPNPNAPFTPPMIVVPNVGSPTNPTVYYGGQDLWQTTNPTSGATWNKRTFVFGSVSAIAAAPSDPNTVYVGFENGTLQVSTDGGVTFASLAVLPAFGSTFVTGISVDPTNAKAITVSVSTNNTRFQLAPPHVAQFSYTTDPSLGTWTVITGNGLPPQAAVSRVVYDNGALVAATDAGVYGTGTVSGGSTSWSLVGTGLPAVQVQDLFVDPTDSTLYAVTHGRGAWKLPVPVAGAADLAITKMASPSPVEAGTNLTYTLSVSNSVAATAATSVVLNDPLPTHTTFVSLVPAAGWLCTTPTVGANGTVNCTRPSLAMADGAQAFTLVVRVDLQTPASTSIGNTATVSSSTVDPTPADNTATTSTPVTFAQSLPAVVRTSTTWLLRNTLLGSGAADTTFAYGTRPLTPMMGDWTGSGTKTAGTFEAGVFKLRNTNTTGGADIMFTFGDPRGFAVAGDFNGDGVDDVAVYRNGVWQIHYLGTSPPPDATFSFGPGGAWPNTVPVVGDWTGTGIDGIGTYTYSTGTWDLRNTASAGVDNIGPFVFTAGAGSYPVTGDWTGNGIYGIGVKLGTTWSIRNTASAGAADNTLTFGLANDLPLTWRQP